LVVPSLLQHSEALAEAPQTSLTHSADTDFPVVVNGQARSYIQVAPALMEPDRKLPSSSPFETSEGEEHRRQLRDSVLDLARCIEKISGAKIAVLTAPPAAGVQSRPIYIGAEATRRFGPVKQKSRYLQGWRIVVSPDGVGLLGETDAGASYAIYELLDRLGCRWFLPGELGEVLPRTPTIRLPESDTSSVPTAAYRGLWYGDDDFKRRNRIGGFKISAGHALERYITEKQREEHPEWRAIVNGKPHPTRLKWSNPAVAAAIADAIIARLEKKYTPSISLSPGDGSDFDESDDTKLDAGDWDPAAGQISLTDRYISLCNRIAARVTEKFPDVRLGFLAYAQYTRPPVREKPHPNLVPEIAPINYCRAHAMTDTAVCPSRPRILPILEGWSKVSPELSYYNYMYHLAEPTAPYPMMHQMSEELPIIFRHNVVFWQPETTSNFESVLPGMWLSMRLAWDKTRSPQRELDELFTMFYGAASTPMRRYWQVFDDAWTSVPEHAGCAWGYMHRFTPSVMQAARGAMDEALAAASTSLEYRRVQLEDNSLRQFERFMQLRHDLCEGRLLDIDLRSTEWLGTQLGLADQYAENSAFTKVGWTPRTNGGTYFINFYGKTYDDAGRIARAYRIISPPLRQWKYRVAHKEDGVAQGWPNSDFADDDWKTTDIAVDTWFALGLESYYGAVWYRCRVKAPAIAAGKKVYLWISGADGNVQVFINGLPVPYVNDKGDKSDYVSGYAKPLSFDITSQLKPNADNQIAIVGTRTFINELGTGGLLEPVYLYREK
jgi:hypothetical protein